MPSPFPGMDPFLEHHWGDVHTSLTTYARNQLRPQLPGDLRARVEEYEVLEVFDEGSGEAPIRQHRKPDVKIVEGVSPKGSPQSTAHVAVATPVIIPLEEETLRRIQIAESQTDRLITVIEFLSYSNKTYRGREQFSQKQNSFWEAGINLVEVDLLRQGLWAMSLPEFLVPKDCCYPYRIHVKSAVSHAAECYRTSIRESLPTISIPLRDGDQPVLLQLQPLIEDAWQDGDYDDIDYAREPLPPFNPEDTQWINEMLTSKGFDRSLATQSKS